MRLHSNARPSFGPRESFRKLRKASFAPLRPAYERLPQDDFPLAQGIPYIAIGQTEPLRSITYGASFRYRSQQLE